MGRVLIGEVPRPYNLMLKHKKLILPLLALMGALYFGAYSDLATNFLLKSAVIVPVQVGACVWLLYLYWSGQLRGTSRYEDKQADRKP